jgi:hypothetical protein
VSKQKSTSTDDLKRLKASLTDVYKSLDAISEAETKLDGQRKAVGKEAINKLKELIHFSPYIKAMRWQQYTPYFNDGDTCEFGVHELEFKFTEEIAGDGDRTKNEDYGWHEFGEYGDDIKEFFEERKDVINFKEITKLEKVVEACEDIHSRLRNIESTLLTAFGDHQQITITRSGIEVDDYEHD